MPKVQRKGGMAIGVSVRDANGHRQGYFEITSGNLYYFRKNAKQVTKKYTWRNLIKLIEADLRE